MDKLFITILNMSFTGAFVIAVICAVRLPLKKAPKIISYCLWTLAGFRLAFPFSIESALSLMPFNTQPIPAEISLSAQSVSPGDLYALSDLRTPYIGDNSAVGAIINALPGLDEFHIQRFYSIGSGGGDYGTNRAPNTLTLYYEPVSPQTDNPRNITNAPKNAILLFALIDNLEEVNIAFRTTPGGNELEQAAYLSNVSQSKEQITEYLATIGLEWADFQNDWPGSVEKLFAGNEPRQ